MSAKGKSIIFRIFAVFVTFVVICVDRISSLTVTSPTDISCYKIICYNNCKQVLPIVDKKFHPPKKTIYFIETSCRGGLPSRAACSVESAAHANPNWSIIVLFAGPLKTEFWKSKTFSKLASMPNTYFYRLIPADLVTGTHMEEIYFERFLSKSIYPVVHSADLLRLLILHKYGGLYLDLDMIVTRSFDSLPVNFIARQRTDEIASGIIAVTKDGVGHKFAELSMRDVANNYNPTSWDSSTNALYTRTLQNICSTNKTSEMSAQFCQGFHVLDKEWFYPIDWADWFLYYKPLKVTELPWDTNEYTHHLWNGVGSQVDPDRNSYYIKLAEKYCPQVYNLYKDKFGQ